MNLLTQAAELFLLLQESNRVHVRQIQSVQTRALQVPANRFQVAQQTFAQSANVCERRIMTQEKVPIAEKISHFYR
jgi:hypothetical protein